MDPALLRQKLSQRETEQRLRRLQPVPDGVDFFSNDYLGIVRNGGLEKSAAGSPLAHGSTGSRLLGGNHPLAEIAEKAIAAFHNSPTALLFNSGYDANLGLISCVAGRGDTILYDQLAHASFRDGARLSPAAAFSFIHNDVNDLERRLLKAQGNCYVFTESVFSMDGDAAPLQAIAECCSRYNAFLIVDEAHATGVAGPKGAGYVQALALEEKCFARIHTFGKALGCHGAVVLGSPVLRDYLVNFCRPFIYTTALPPVALEAIAASYRLFPTMEKERRKLKELIAAFTEQASGWNTASFAGNSAGIKSESPVQAVIIPGNEKVSRAAFHLRELGLAVYPIFSPTVPPGSERLRIVLHVYNSSEDIARLTREIVKLVG